MSVQREVGIFEAKTHLSELVSEVEAGLNVILTRRGVPVARLLPMERLPDRAGALRRLQELGDRVKESGGAVTRDEVLSWRDEGRRA